MHMRSLTPTRRGLTLTESLVALFVAAIGMISLLTLFPLGAIQMGQALKDRRCTETATNFEVLLRRYWQDDLEAERMNGTTSTFLTAIRSGPPIFVDPLGNSVMSFAFRNTVAGPSGPTRIGLPRLVNFNQRFRFCSLLDDLSYEDGKPVITGGSVERGGRYNAMAMIQRIPGDQYGLTILVFDGRSPTYMPDSNETLYSATTNAVSFPVTRTSIRFNYASHPTNPERPTIGRGRWIALHSPAQNAITFHRIASLDDSNDPELILELQDAIPHVHMSGSTNIIVFAGLAEVYVRPPLRTE